jgi:hypothetical protein
VSLEQEWHGRAPTLLEHVIGTDERQGSFPSMPQYFDGGPRPERGLLLVSEVAPLARGHLGDVDTTGLSRATTTNTNSMWW